MSGRAKARLSILVNRKPDEVFAYIADVHKHGEWSPKAYRTEGWAARSRRTDGCRRTLTIATRSR